MCGACEDEVFLTTPNPHCVLRGFAPAGAPSRRSFIASEVVDDAARVDQRARLAPAVALPLLSLAAGRARAAMSARP